MPADPIVRDSQPGANYKADNSCGSGQAVEFVIAGRQNGDAHLARGIHYVHCVKNDYEDGPCSIAGTSDENPVINGNYSP